MRLTVEGPNSGKFRWAIVAAVDQQGPDLAAALAGALAQADRGCVQLWLQEVSETGDAAAADLGFEAYRDLHQLRCVLPQPASGLVTRGFTPADIDDFVRVNNRAFHWHPEQGKLTRTDVESAMGEPWFDPDGFRLLHHGDELVGFCWTKIHVDHDPPLGEIYVVAVDPAHHGHGLGKLVTLAGLEWLTARGLQHGMLYVESDNSAANATYRAIGFNRHHIDRAYLLDLP